MRVLWTPEAQEDRRQIWDYIAEENPVAAARMDQRFSDMVAMLSQHPEIGRPGLVALRTRLHLSRPVFARYLRTNPRTLENWEQGRARPNAQAALLIRLVERYPDTVERLAAV